MSGNRTSKVKMPVKNIMVDLSARLVFVRDSKCVACSSCPEWEFSTLMRAFLHSLKHRSRCSNGYPTTNNDNGMVTCCPKIVTHEKCIDSAIYGAVILIRLEIVDEKVELRVKCNFKKENPQNQDKPLNKPCNEEFDNIDSYNRHVGATHCQWLRKRQNGRFTSPRLLIGTILDELEDDDKFGEKVIYNFESTAWIKQPNLLYSKPRANELRTQLKLLNLISENTLNNDVFISEVVGFDIKLLDKKVIKWGEKNPGSTLRKKHSIIKSFVQELMPSVATVQFHTTMFVPITIAN